MLSEIGHFAFILRLCKALGGLPGVMDPRYRMVRLTEKNDRVATSTAVEVA